VFGKDQGETVGVYKRGLFGKRKSRQEERTLGNNKKGGCGFGRKEEELGFSCRGRRY